MKKLFSISEQIKNNTYSYTGRGGFEEIVNKNKNTIIEWLENLVPLQVQISRLSEESNTVFQKRNYTRILTKLLPDQYKEFVSLNILIRDSKEIAQYYREEFNLTYLYKKLIEDGFLKYPGKSEKYVEFDFFQKFLMLYRDDIMESLDLIESSNVNPTTKYEINTVEETEEMIDDEIVIQSTIIVEEKVVPKETTNWTNLLLGRK